MFAFPRRRRPDVIGLDFSDDAVRLLHLHFRAPDWMIKNYATASLPAGAISAGHIQQPQLVQTVLQNLLAQLPSTGLAAVIALPVQAVMHQVIYLPRGLTSPDYEMTIHANLGKYFPGMSGPLSFDFLCKQNDASLAQEILVVAAHQGQVESCLALANAVGIQVIKVGLPFTLLLTDNKVFMEEINLLPWRENQKRRRRKFFIAGFVLGFLILTLMLKNFIWPQPIKMVQSALIATPAEQPLQGFTWRGFMRQGQLSIGLLLLPDGTLRAVQIGDVLLPSHASVVTINAEGLTVQLPNHLQYSLKGYRHA